MWGNPRTKIEQVKMSKRIREIVRLRALFTSLFVLQLLGVGVGLVGVTPQFNDNVN